MDRIFYTDGGCRPTNPGPGGWGWIEVQDNKIYDYTMSYSNQTTNNRMELEAVLNILKHIDENSKDNYIIYSDSAYVVNIINTWMQGWQKNGWTRAKGKLIENLDLIKEIYKYYNKNIWNVQVVKCKGHSGDIYNDLVDGLTWSEEEFKNRAKKYNIEIL